MSASLPPASQLTFPAGLDGKPIVDEPSSPRHLASPLIIGHSLLNSCLDKSWAFVALHDDHIQPYPSFDPRLCQRLSSLPSAARPFSDTHVRIFYHLPPRDLSMLLFEYLRTPSRLTHLAINFLQQPASTNVFKHRVQPSHSSSTLPFDTHIRSLPSKPALVDTVNNHPSCKIVLCNRLGQLPSITALSSTLLFPRLLDTHLQPLPFNFRLDTPIDSRPDDRLQAKHLSRTLLLTSFLGISLDAFPEHTP